VIATVTALIATYNLPLVVLSVVIGIITSYTALDLVGRVTAAQGRERKLWLIGGAIAMGIGIWSMHFIGMLAYDLPIPMSHDCSIVLASMVVTIIVSGAALLIVSRQQLSQLALLVGGIFMGLGIAAMHYTGMAAMRLQAIAHYNPVLVGLSIAIAIIASLIALWLAFKLRADNTLIGSVRRFGSAILMGSAIAGTHYTAMAAVSFEITEQPGLHSSHLIRHSMLAVGVAIAALIVMTLAMVASIFDQRLNIQLARAETLHQSEERFRSLVQNASDIIAVVATDGTISYTSASVQRILGYPPQDWLGKKVFQFVHPEDRDMAENLIEQAIAFPGIDITAEFRLLHADREVRDFEVSANNLLAQPEIAGIVTTYRDITVRKRNELALRKSEESYRAFVEQSSEGIWRFELEQPLSTDLSEDEQIQHLYQYGYLAECNNAMAQMYGFTYAEEIVGARLADFLISSDPYNIEYLRSFIRSGYRLNDAESHELDKQGGSKYFLNNLVGIVENDVLVRAWGSQRDISERKQAEEALRNNQKRLELAQKAGKIGTFEWNIQTDRVTWTEELEAVYGLAAGTFGGNYDNWAHSLHPEDRARTEQEVRRAAMEGTELDTEFRILSPDGSLRWIAAKAHVFCDRTGKPLRMIGVNMDNTNRKQAEVEREQLLAREQAARAEAEAANRIKDEFLATLSHELRTPLNAMLGWIQLLRTRKFDEATTTRALETIDRNTKSLAQLIEDVLDVSRIITGKLRLNVRPVELVPVISAAIETVLPAAEAKDIQLKSLFDTPAGPVLGDANRLQQVVWNLLSNAVKFTPKGGLVEIRLAVINSRVQIRVSDTGQGISPDFLPYVFERFRQADSSITRSQGGLGLGLAIVRHLVELHGGTVYAESLGVGQGATFIVELPLMAVRLVAASEPEQVEPKVADTDEVPKLCPLSLNGLRVLIVDDEPDARELIVTVLGQCGAEVKAVASAVEALEVLEQFQPHVLVSDIGMPGEDGYALIRQLRALDAKQGGEIPAVALTAYARAEDRTQALLAGFQLHVPKPVDPSELAVVVGNLAGRSK